MKKNIILFGNRETGKTTYCERMVSKYPKDAVLRWDNNVTYLISFLSALPPTSIRYQLIILEGVNLIESILKLKQFFYENYSPTFENIKLIITSNSLFPSDFIPVFCQLRDAFRLVDMNSKMEWKFLTYSGAVMKKGFAPKVLRSNPNTEPLAKQFLTMFEEELIDKEDILAKFKDLILNNKIKLRKNHVDKVPIEFIKALKKVSKFIDIIQNDANLLSEVFELAKDPISNGHMFVALANKYVK